MSNREIRAWRSDDATSAYAPVTAPHVGVDRGLAQELVPAIARGRVTVTGLGGIGSSGPMFSSTGLHRTHRPRKNH